MIASAKDLDLLLAQLKGDSADQLLQAVSAVESEDDDTQVSEMT